MNPIFRIEWPRATPKEVIFIAVLLLLLVIIYFFVKYLQLQNRKKAREDSLFLIKTRQLGLSSFQIKLLNNMIEMLQLTRPDRILAEPALFENSAGKLLSFLKQKQEGSFSISSVCRDLTIAYEKLYHPSSAKKPLERIQDIEADRLLYFVADDNNVYFGKIIDTAEDSIVVRMFRSAKELQFLETESTMKVTIWRLGDAEYYFTTTGILRGDRLIMKAPDEFTREQEFRYPYVDTILLCEISTEADDGETPEKIRATIFKINEKESVIRLKQTLDYSSEYILEFELSDFKFTIKSKIIANRSISEAHINYYTLKFGEISPAAVNVLKNYLIEHL